MSVLLEKLISNVANKFNLSKILPVVKINKYSNLNEYICTLATESKSNSNILRGCTGVLLKLKTKLSWLWRILENYFFCQLPLHLIHILFFILLVKMFSLWPPSEENCIHV